MKIKELFKKMVAAEIACDKAERAWDEDIMNDALEAEFDKCYQESFEATEAVVKEIEKLIKVDSQTARAMIHSKRAELENLISRIA